MFLLAYKDRILFFYPMFIDGQGNGAQLENKVSQRKSNSISPREIIAQNSHKYSNDSGSAKSNKILTNSGNALLLYHCCQQIFVSASANPCSYDFLSLAIFSLVHASNLRLLTPLNLAAKPNSSPAQATAAPPSRAAPDTSHGKNKFFLAKWFGFGSK